MRRGADQVGALAAPRHARAGDADLVLEIGHQRFGNDQLVAGLGLRALGNRFDLEQHVVDRGAGRERAVAGNGPGRGGPDHDRSARQLLHRRGDDRELDPDRVRGVVVILDLGLGERGLLHHRPHDRLGAAIEPAIHQELADLGDDHRLGLVRHGEVRVVPIAFDAEALELLALHVDPFLGEVAALLAELVDRHRVLVLAGLPVLLLDLPFDRQAVAVPARNVVGVLADHLLLAVDHVLQDLVEGVADMDVGVGVGRAVMQDELRPPLGLAPQFLEQLHVRPALQDLRLALRQVAAHREIGLGQENGALVVHEQSLS